MNPFLVKVPLNSPNYLGLTFDKHFSSDELSEMESTFKDMAKRYRHLPNLHSACRFMHLNLLNHARFSTYLLTPAALRICAIGLYNVPFNPPFVNTTLSATCLFSESDFIRFKIKGYEVAGLWVRKTSFNQNEIPVQLLPFNVNLDSYYGDERMQLKLFGDTYMSELQSILIQVIAMMDFDNSKMN